MNGLRASILLSTVALLTLTSAARAQSCTTITGCPTGFTCQTVTHDSSCATPICFGEGGCPPPPPCPPPTVTQECGPAPCTSDLGCPVGMACYTDTGSDCTSSSGGMAPSCTTKTTRYCLPHWLLPCVTASDCGSGFSCALAQDCSGSSNGTPTCSSSSTGRCKVEETPCASSNGCPADWTCGQVSVGGDQSCTSGGSVTDGGFVHSSPPVCTTQPSTTKMLCLPPYYEQFAKFEESSSSKNTPARSTSGTGTGGSNDSGGCQMALGHTSGAGTAFLGLLGLLGLSRRRRARG